MSGRMYFSHFLMCLPSVRDATSLRFITSFCLFTQSSLKRRSNLICTGLSRRRKQTCTTQSFLPTVSPGHDSTTPPFSNFIEVDSPSEDEGCLHRPSTSYHWVVSLYDYGVQRQQATCPQTQSTYSNSNFISNEDSILFSYLTSSFIIFPRWFQ